LITGLTHAAVRVTSISESLEFYCELLGLPEQFRLTRDNGDPWLIYLKVAERQFIELFPGAAGPHTDPAGAGVVHVCLEVDDIQATYKEFTARGLSTNGEPKLGADGSWQFWTADPDGNPIEFHQFTPESKQISSVS
jgi:catechol 2,3-dioxygenase-like lactoylglutathione lyase family enzyme